MEDKTTSPFLSSVFFLYVAALGSFLSFSTVSETLVSIVTLLCSSKITDKSQSSASSQYSKNFGSTFPVVMIITMKIVKIIILIIMLKYSYALCIF